MFDYTRRVYFDGGMGTLLQAMGLSGGERPESWNISRPQDVRRAHLSYLEAGADIIAANTFGATREHMGGQYEAAMSAGVRIALESVCEAGRGAVAIDMGSLGRLLEPYGDMPFDEAVRQFREAFECGLRAGGQLALIETITDQLEAKAAVLGAREAMELTGISAPIFCSLTFDTEGRLLTGASIEGAVAMLAALGVDAIGINCGREPRALVNNARRLAACSPVPIFVCPNASLPVEVDGRTVFPTDPDDFAAQMREIAALGAWGLGGCCGTTPAHIRALIDATRDMPVKAPFGGGALVLSGRGACLTLGGRPAVIGERLNPTGKPRMKRALREGDTGALLREAVMQADAGADALDVNVGLPDIDEARTLRRVVTAVQGVCELPLMLDSSDASALEAALRVYSGRPIINSVCGKREVMDAVLPLAKRYGGALVALTLDEDGIPPTAEGRLGIARRIIDEAAKYGIPKSALVFDALTMTVAADEGAARVTLETLRALKNELGVYTVLGVSNASHGLPQRPLINAAFIALAVENGLDAAIMNPCDRLCRAMLDASSALCGRDAGFGAYIGRYAEAARLELCEGDGAAGASASGGASAVTSDGASGAVSIAAPAGRAALISAVKKGLRADALAAVEALADAGESPLSLINDCIMPALREVGELYEAGRMYLPQLLASAAAAQDALNSGRMSLPPSEGGDGRVIVTATVKGDVHDIGKNIVVMLLKNYGYTVYDLGRDVPPESVLAAARERGARLVGLSALMTTTVPAMRETIALLHAELPDTRVMVGGAVLTEEYAAKIGADYYAKDAMGAVRVADEVFGR